MELRRTIVFHAKVDSVVIDSFRCDRCNWSYSTTDLEPFVIGYEDALRAYAAFDEHICVSFKSRKADRESRRSSKSSSDARVFQSG